MLLIAIIIKGTVSVISSDPPCKDGNARFTTGPLKALPDQVWIRHSCLFIFKLFIFISDFSAKWLAYFLLIKALGKLTETKTLWVRKNEVIFHSFDQIFKGNVVNRAFSSLHGGSLQSTVTVPLMLIYSTRRRRSHFFTKLRTRDWPLVWMSWWPWAPRICQYTARFVVCVNRSLILVDILE